MGKSRNSKWYESSHFDDIGYSDEHSDRRKKKTKDVQRQQERKTKKRFEEPDYDDYDDYDDDYSRR